MQKLAGQSWLGKHTVAEQEVKGSCLAQQHAEGRRSLM